ncbi:M15 family metallopeptidase [Mesorhizobium sp. ASY16-5R]|uniref:M15 family metallopeptidase n=1 Tax=Mesorhizobium sp. ASY16-5R TaxID=3445772 RepID=UPI003F9FE50B
MVKLPDATDLGVRLPGMARGQPAYPRGNPIASALRGFGNTAAGIGFDHMAEQRARDEKDIAYGAEDRWVRFQDGQKNLLIQSQRTAPPAGVGFTDKFRKQYEDSANQFYASLPPELQAPFKARLSSFAGDLQTSASDFERNARRTDYGNRTNDSLVTIANAAHGNPDGYQGSLDQAYRLIDAMPDDAYSPIEKEEFRRKAKRDVQLAAINGMTPEQRLNALGKGAPGGDAVADVVDQIIGAESSGDPNAQNPNSTAGGLGGFTDKTWVGMIRTKRPDIARGMSNDQIIELKKSEPGLAREMTAELVGENYDILTKLGVAPTPGNLYAAHFAGEPTARKLFAASDDAPASQVFGEDALTSNPFLKKQTVGQFKSWAAEKMAGAEGSTARGPTRSLPDLATANSFLKTRLVGHTAEHIDGMKPELQTRLAALFQSAPAGIREKLGIVSGRRSVERQRQLWEASDKSGKWVGSPEGSRHVHGDAADLGYDGQRLDKAPADVQKWVHDNAAAFDLKFPLGHEAWHVETSETRGGKAGVPLTGAIDPRFEDFDYALRDKIIDTANTEIKQQRIETRGMLDIVTANAPVATQNTGSYSGPLPTAEQFMAGYGPQEGADRYNKFMATMDVAQQAYAFRTMPTEEVQQAVVDATPVSSGDNAALEQDRYEAVAAAAKSTIEAREADPATYTMQTYPAVAAAWDDASDTEGGYSIALAKTAAAQQQLGIRNPRLLPKPIASAAIATYANEDATLDDRIAGPAQLILATPDQTQRQAIFSQLVDAGMPEATEGAFEALARGDTDAGRRLFQAATLDPTKLPGKVGPSTDAINTRIQELVMAPGQIGDAVYGLSTGIPDNLDRAQRDDRLIFNAVQLRLRQGQELDVAISGAAKDIYGDVQVVTGDANTNAIVTAPKDADPTVIRNGLAQLKPQVRAALEAQRSRLLPSAAPKGDAPGLMASGNIDLAARPVVTNADGSISTVRSMSFEEDDGTEILVPTISPDGKTLSDDEAISLYRKTGQYLGKFDTPEHATAYAERLHAAQEQFYTTRRSGLGELAGAGLEAATDNILAEGVFRNADGGYSFIDPYSGLAIGGPDGKPLVFTLDEVTKADADLAGAEKAGAFVGGLVKPPSDKPRRAPPITPPANETVTPDLTGAGRPAAPITDTVSEMAPDANMGIRDATMRNDLTGSARPAPDLPPPVAADANVGIREALNPKVEQATGKAAEPSFISWLASAIASSELMRPLSDVVPESQRQAIMQGLSVAKVNNYLKAVKDGEGVEKAARPDDVGTFLSRLRDATSDLWRPIGEAGR